MPKRKIGDRRDGRLIRELDPLHQITGILYPNRCDNEAFVREVIDLTNINEYLKKKNYEGIPYRYNLFQIVVTAVLKMIKQRPKMNRFIVNGNFYQRNETSAAFVVKKLFSDSGAEALAFVRAGDDDTIDSVHQNIYDQVSFCRSEKLDSASQSMDIVTKLPRCLVKTVVRGARILDRYGLMPQAAIDTDPYYASCVISNVGSIKLHSGYHHLTNWGTCSMFVMMGTIKDRPFYNEDGSYEMRPSVDLGFTIDERLADGYYYSKSIRLFKKLMENPELLERPLLEPIDFE